MLNKKGSTLNMLLPAALVVGVAIIGVSIVAQVLGTVSASQTAASAEKNITDAGLTAMGTFSDWWGIIIIVVIAVIVIGLLMFLKGQSTD